MFQVLVTSVLLLISLMVASDLRAEYGCSLALDEVPDRVGTIIGPILQNAPHQSAAKQQILVRLSRLEKELDLCEEHYYALVGNPDHLIPSPEATLVTLYERVRSIVRGLVAATKDDDPYNYTNSSYRFLRFIFIRPGGLQVIIHPTYSCSENPHRGNVCDA